MLWGVMQDDPSEVVGKVDKAAVRPAMLDGSETWATTKRQETRLDVNQMKMLRWMCGVTT